MNLHPAHLLVPILLLPLGCKRTTPANPPLVTPPADTTALYGSWLRTRDSSEVTDAIRVAAMLPGADAGMLVLTCVRGRPLFQVSGDPASSGEKVRVSYRQDQQAAVTGQWGASGGSVFPPAAIDSLWRHGGLSSADSLRIEFPGGRVLRWGLAGTDSALSWMRANCQ